MIDKTLFIILVFLVSILVDINLSISTKLNKELSSLDKAKVLNNRLDPPVPDDNTPDHFPVPEYSKLDKKCLALNIYWEARNQPKRGMIAVGLVTLNRVLHDKFPDDICSVVYQTRGPGKCQFSWVCTHKNRITHEKTAWNQSIEIATNILNKKYNDHDFTKGALHYHAYYVTPYWSKKLKFHIKIGSHLFYE
jgi:spore germination cell wall hydrolase CwlJ-like protein